MAIGFDSEPFSEDSQEGRKQPARSMVSLGDSRCCPPCGKF